MERHTSLISENTYKNLTQNNNLNSLWRNLFSPIDSVEQIDYLLAEMQKVRQQLLDMQPEMSHSLNEGILRSTTLRIIIDSQGTLNRKYLRWRNMKGNRGGADLLREFFQDPNQPDILKEALQKANQERIVVNMQMQILTNIIRQLKKARSEFSELD